MDTTERTPQIPVAGQASRALPPRPGKDAPFHRYALGKPHDELFTADGFPRLHARRLYDALATLPPEDLARRQHACEQTFLHQGITFTVYGHADATEKIIPTDLLPRIVPAHEWDTLDRGLRQRLTALNLFLKDVYGEGRILAQGIVPAELVLGSKHYVREMRGVSIPFDNYVNVCGTDIIRREDGAFVVLEDNLRVPSGVSYMLANREVAKRAFPDLYRALHVRPIEHYA